MTDSRAIFPPGLEETDVSRRTLYGRIQAFQLDRPDARFPFSERLAVENGWSPDYAKRAIEEYKRFTFLAVAAGHPVTPSDAIDQVWHLHLSYTRSYWGEFCQEILRTLLHHEPTRGGLSERRKHEEQYRQTLESYARFFGHEPPGDIWPDPKKRFDPKTRFVRVNAGKNWIVSKPVLPELAWKRGASHALIFSIATGFVTGCGTISNFRSPLDLRGPDFLVFYFCLSIVVLCLSVWLRHFLRIPGPPRSMVPVSLDAYETAYLAGNTARVVDTTIAALVQKGYASVGTDKRTLTLTGKTEELSSPVERVVADSIASRGRIDRVRAGLATSALGGETRARYPDLFVTPSVSETTRVYPTLALASVLALGAAKILVGLSHGRPVGYLTIACAILAFITLGFWTAPAYRSRYGDSVLDDLRHRIGFRRSNPPNDGDPELPRAVALFGTSILIGGILGGLGESFTVASSGNGGGIDSGGDGGGCGGGCGGCGG